MVMQHGVLYIVACKSGSVLPTIGLSILLIVLAQHMLNITLVVRSPFIVAADLSRSSPPPGTVVHNITDHRRPVDDHRWTFAQLLSVLQRRVLEYFDPGSTPASIKPPKPLCPLPGRPTGIVGLSFENVFLRTRSLHGFRVNTLRLCMYVCLYRL